MSAQLALPLARTDDPETSYEAARSVRAANAEIVDYIRRAVERYGPLSHEHIAAVVCDAQPGRWLPATVVTACARAGLVADGMTVNGRGRNVTTWVTE